MKLEKTAMRICGIVGGTLFVLQALYTIWIYVRLTGGNLLSLLAPAEYLLLGAMALLNRREKGLIIGAWLLLVHNALSLLTSFISVAAAEQLSPVVRNLMLASTVGNLSAVLLAVVLLKSVRQLTFLQEKLNASSSKIHIVMCHPPLLSHNPQRTADMAPYIVAEQDARLQKIIDENKNVIFLSGHTHVSPTIEMDEVRGNLYINDGSICPTTVKDTADTTQQGNVTLLDISETEISVTIKGIYSEKIFAEESQNDAFINNCFP